MTWREYHDVTKHTPESLRRRRHYLDWANMPDPFRHYEGAPVLDLPADPPAPSMPTLDVLSSQSGQIAAGNGPDFLSQLLFYSAAISATKLVPSTGYRYALRVNPSSGNLHPTEFHFCTRGLQDWPDGLYHYRPSSHMAEQRAVGDFTSRLHTDAPVVFLLTSIAWREAWKYQERAYRYCLLDIGHAWQSLATAARTIGCEVSATGHFADESIARDFGLHSDEWPMVIVSIDGPGIPSRHVSAEHVTSFVGEANVLSTECVPYPAIDAVHATTSLPECTTVGKMEESPRVNGPECPSRPFGDVARSRRSALDFVGGKQSMTRDQLLAILQVAAPQELELYIYLHRVAEFEPGVYQYSSTGNALKLIRAGDQRLTAAALSLQQDLAGNACIAISMVANLERMCAQHGPRGYRYAHFEAGAVGQRLYLAAESLGLRATGMGAFFDDEVHRYLNLTPAEGEVVYHFAIGYPVRDDRIEAQA